MIRPAIALFLAAQGLSGCATLNRACDLAIPATATAQDVITILQRDWRLSSDKAAGWASIILKGSAGVQLFCAAIPAPPVAVPGL